MIFPCESATALCCTSSHTDVTIGQIWTPDCRCTMSKEKFACQTEHLRLCCTVIYPMLA